ncbi:MAG: TolC family protein [Planctomycetota bacterium]|nr:TolC family protein [Planctomycetota bacterium]
MQARRYAACLRCATAIALMALAGSGCTQGPTRTTEWIAQEVSKSIESSAHPAVTELPSGAAAPILPTPVNGEIRLTLLEALTLALANNHDIQIAGLQPPTAEQDITVAEAVFDPTAYGNGTVGRVNRPTQSILDTGTTRETNLLQKTVAWQAGLKQKLPTGGTLALSEATDYLNTNSTLTVPNPQSATRTTVELAQPLLRGGGIEYNTAAIKVANLNSAVSFQDFRKSVQDAVASVVNAYWQLAFDLESIRVSRASRDLAAEVLRREQARRARGVSSDIDLNRAASAVALREADVLRAENQARDTVDKVKMLLNAPDLSLASETRLIPTEAPRFFLVSIDRTAAIATALVRRPDMERARNAVAINRIRLDVADRDRLPKLDATMRYIMNGLNTDYIPAIEQQDPGERLSWNVGVEFEMPLGNRSADATRRKRLLEYDQSLVEMSKLASQVIQEVNGAARAVLLARSEIEANLTAKTAAARTVQGEQRRFELGETTNDELLRAQETLATAERDYLRALMNFNLGLVSLERAQGVLLENQGIDIFQPPSSPEHPMPVGLRMAPGRAEQKKSK